MRAWQLAVDVPVPECIYTSGSNIMILVDEEVCGDIPEKTLAAIELKAEQYGFQGLASNIARLRGEILIRSGRRREADQISDRAIRNFAADDRRCSAEIEESRKVSSAHSTIIVSCRRRMSHSRGTPSAGETSI